MVTDDVFSVVAESTRREILAALRGGDKSVGQLVEELEASQPTVSKHLRVLREATLVTMRAEGQKRFYSLNPAPLAAVVGWLAEIGAPGMDAAPAQQSDPQGLDAAHIQTTVVPERRDARTAQRPAVERPQAATAAASAQAPAPAQPQEPARAGVSAAAAMLEAGVHPAAAGGPNGTRPGAGAGTGTGTAVGRPVERSMAPAAARSTEGEASMPAQIGRSVGRAANKAADLLANLPKPKFGRRKE
ncbi:ArsR/SmtB family transcription factor [Arthrobacter sp. 35W]|uniref:ArsR/SmtB family transcription factor n=1 Tax=Arthrobacter sp. 35W TaxID=1132441 RepID=UPI00041F939F|nr:metalloregulator ArsR/SmtB family transcription factor [Arthrobacter sp. 35W]